MLKHLANGFDKFGEASGKWIGMYVVIMLIISSDTSLTMRIFAIVFTVITFLLGALESINENMKENVENE